MKPRHTLGVRDAGDIFDRAVQERALAVLTMQNGQDWTSFKSRFLERDPHGRFFVLDYEPLDGGALPSVAPGQYVGVSFRQRSRKILFATLIEAKGHFILDNQTSVAAVRYRWPEALTELQRRAYYRTPVPGQVTLLVSLWPGGTTARTVAQGQTLQILTGDLGDLSCGGAYIHLHQPAPPPWSQDELLGAEVQMPDGGPPLLVNARYRGARADESGGTGIAVQFLGLELSLEGCDALQRIANGVHRLHRMSGGRGQRDWNNKRSF